MATTTNYSWTTPDDTALVKDGAAAIRSLGTAIDTTVFNNAGAAIAKTIVDAKGDLIVATAADTVARLASSATNGDLLTVDTSTASGLKWAAPAPGALTLINTTNFSSVTSQSLNNVFTSTYTNYKIIVNVTSTATSGGMRVRLRVSGADATGSNYLNRNIYIDGNSTVTGEYSTQTTGFFGSSHANGGGIVATFFNPNLASRTYVVGQNIAESNNQLDAITHDLSTAYDGLTIYTSNSANMTGSISVYGYSK